MVARRAMHSAGLHTAVALWCALLVACLPPVPAHTDCNERRDCEQGEECIDYECLPVGAVAGCSEEETALIGQCCSSPFAGDDRRACACGATYVCDQGELQCWSAPQTCDQGCGPVVEVGAPCFGEATWECNRHGTLECALAEGDEDGCGGSASLPAARTCHTNEHNRNDGRYVCNGPDDVTCVSREINACGGKGRLDGEPGRPCGPCEYSTTARWRCESPESTVCCDDESCHSALGLPAMTCDDAPPPVPCGRCGQGTWVPRGITWECVGDATNACGGCEPLEDVLGERCGDNGRRVHCAGPNATICAVADRSCRGGEPCGNNSAVGQLVCLGPQSSACAPAWAAP